MTDSGRRKPFFDVFPTLLLPQDLRELFSNVSVKMILRSKDRKSFHIYTESRMIIQNVFTGPEAYAVCRKEDNHAIGAIELKLQGHTDMSDRSDECELGYWIGKPFWGQGMMPEAAEEILRHAFEDLGMRAVWAGYYDGNTKSKRVQEKCGFVYVRTTQNLEVPLMHETRTGHCNVLTKDRWQELHRK